MRTDLTVIASAHLAAGGDPITALMTRDWAALGGWSLFLGFCVFAVWGAVREWWVPGARYRRSEQDRKAAQDALKATQEALTTALAQNGELLKSAQLTEYFFREVLPKKGGTAP